MENPFHAWESQTTCPGWSHTDATRGPLLSGTKFTWCCVVSQNALLKHDARRLSGTTHPSRASCTRRRRRVTHHKHVASHTPQSAPLWRTGLVKSVLGSVEAFDVLIIRRSAASLGAPGLPGSGPAQRMRRTMLTCACNTPNPLPTPKCT